MQSRKKILSMSISARALSGFASLILYSENEVLKPSNTGRLIADICEDTYAFQWHRTDRPAELESLFKSDKYQPVLVFPKNYLVESNSVIEPKQIATLEKRLCLSS
ncbi:cytoplasmic protein [Vibrio sp. JCM 19236]|nr:cytoplasmic protein [Vibrio sp. JCM 19236]